MCCTPNEASVVNFMLIIGLKFEPKFIAKSA